MWMGLLLAATVILYPTPRGECWYMVWLGAWLAQACLPAVWAGLAQQPLGVHLPGALTLAAVLTVTTAWASSRSESTLANTLTLVLAMLVSGPVYLVPLALLRRFLGWRIALPEEHYSAEQRSMQFSLRQLLAWMGIAAALLAWATSVLPDRTELQEAWQGYNASTGIVFGAAFVALGLPILIPSIGLVLVRRHRIWFALGTLAGASLFIPGFLRVASGGRPPSWYEILVPLGVLEGAFLGVLLGTLMILRFCGYRLLRRKEERLAAQSPTIAASESTTKPPRLHLSPFSYLVAMMLLAGLLLGDLAWEREPARRETATQREFQRAGMAVNLEDGQIAGISFNSNRPLSEAGLKKLQRLRTTPTFQQLSLEGTKLADDQVHYLCGLMPLRSLLLSGTPITDAGLAQLSGLDNLQCLYLDGTRVTDAGLKHLAQFANLENLNLAGTCITGAGLAQLNHLPRLHTLNLASTPVTDASLAHLAKLPNLQSLSLARTSITDAGMEHLAKLTNLEELRLAGTKVTDAGLNSLRSLKKLRMLDKSPTTAAGLEEFRRAMPQCEINPGY
jgi:hypothetical protein